MLQLFCLKAENFKVRITSTLPHDLPHNLHVPHHYLVTCLMIMSYLSVAIGTQGVIIKLSQCTCSQVYRPHLTKVIVYYATLSGYAIDTSDTMLGLVSVCTTTSSMYI